MSLAISFLLALISWMASIIEQYPYFGIENVIGIFIWANILVLPGVLTLENICLLFMKPQSDDKEKAVKRWEIVAIGIGSVFSISLFAITNILFSDWNVQLYNSDLHSPIATKAFLTIGVITLIAVLGYAILRFSPLEKLPPLFAVLCISALYLGIAVSLLWCVQIFKGLNLSMFLLSLFPLNCILIAIRTIRHVVYQQIDRTQNTSFKYKGMVALLNHSSNWPWLAFIAAIPLLGIIVLVLLLFGQEPDHFIKAWTETADWNMSQKVAPQNIFKDEHYLCTVAAGGHQKIVKPIRTGKRHGHRVIVNRQLSVANAFEQLIEERLPRFHRIVRTTYDTVGYPIAKHIHSPYTADVIYFIMKPLEWLFLITLYLFDVKPENRIAVQYPHSDFKMFQIEK